MSHIWFRLSFLLILVVTAFAISFAKVRYTSSDPRGTLLVTQSILQHGTIKLDQYDATTLKQYPVYQTRGHYYYFFPIGTSLVSLPFVAVAISLGLDMTNDEPAMQVIIACITALFTIVFLYALARLFLTRAHSLLVSSIFWFGTSFSSTCGTALWSHNFGALFGLVSIYLAIKSTRTNSAWLSLLVAPLLFLSYLCRPTMALLAPFAIAYIFLHDRKAAARNAILLAIFGAAFIAFSYSEFRELLPTYYLPQRLAGGSFNDAVLGNLISPARGLFVFSPFIVFAVLFARHYARRPEADTALLLIGLAWPILHLLFISRFPHWWAGWSYGPRFMTDALPGLFLLTLCTWPRIKSSNAIGLTLFSASVAFSVFVNSFQGLYNIYTSNWNAEPNVDVYREYLFDWRYPQFLHNARRHQRRLEDFRRHTIDFKSQSAVFVDWSAPESLFRWSSGHNSKIFFNLKDRNDFSGKLLMRFRTLGQQRIRVNLNGSPIGEFNNSGVNHEPGLRISSDKVEIEFSPTLLIQGENVLEFLMPDARRPDDGAPGTQALALFYLTIR